MLDWLVLDLNSFFASCEQQDNPSLRGKPVGVVPMITDHTSLLAASKEAKKFGLKTGTSVLDAKARCPDITLIQASHRKYVEYHNHILVAIDKIMPIEQVLSIDEVACRLTGTQRNPEKAIALAKAMKAQILKDVGECLTSSVGISTNTLLAKLASDMQKPDGLTVLAAEDIPGKILHLPVQAIPGVGYGMSARLKEAGVTTMADLYNLSEAETVRIWGGSIVGRRYYHRLRGSDLKLPGTQTRSLGHEHVLEPELRNRQGSLTVLRQLIVKGAERLRRKGYYASRITVHSRCYHPERAHWDKMEDLPETQDTRALLAAMERLWKSMPHTRPHKVGVVFSGLVQAEHHQPSLFVDDEDPKNLFNAVDKVNSRYGPNTLYFASPEQLRKKVQEHKIAFSSVPDTSAFPPREPTTRKSSY